jgi:hypothetical protein
MVGIDEFENSHRQQVTSRVREEAPGPGRQRPWWPFVTAIVVGGVAVSVLIPAGRHQWALSILHQPTTFTALSFNHPGSLPTAAKDGHSVAFTFSIGNHEGHTVRYTYVVTSSPGGSAPITSTAAVSDGRTRAIAVSLEPRCNGSPCRIQVALPSENQSIDFLVFVPKHSSG